MSLEDDKKEGEQKKPEEIKPILESKESFEDVSKSLEDEMEKSSEDFSNQDERVNNLEKSVNLTNPDSVNEIKKELNLEENLNHLNNQAEELKKQTKQLIEWLKLDDPKFDENSFYRVVDEKGFRDYQDNQIVRSSPTGTDSHMVKNIDIGHRPTSFPSFAKGKPDLSYTREGEDNYIFESNIPMYKAGEKNPVTGNNIKARHWAYRPIDQKTGEVIKEMTPEMINNVYKIDKQGDIYVQKKELEQSPENQEKTEKMPEDFRIAGQILLETLEGKEKSAQEGYVFTYGSLVEKTSKGKEVNIDTLSWIGDDGFGSRNKRRLVLVGTNPENGKIIGLRLSDIRDGKITWDKDIRGISNLDATGEILTRSRGEGIATALDTGFIKILTRVANEYKQKYHGEHQLNWKVENRHLKRIEQTQKRNTESSETNNKQREEEQKRWQALYGEGGKFGLQKEDKYDYSRTIDTNIEEGVSYAMQSVDINKFKEIINALKEFESEDTGI